MSNEKPILFKDDMIRAILEGRKTQTRRIMKPQPHPDFLARGVCAVVPQWPDQDGVRWYMADGLSEIQSSPFGKPGDRLWVRETWADAGYDDGLCICYRADKERKDVTSNHAATFGRLKYSNWAPDLESGTEGQWKPSIHMPRWASRITLEITDVRVERLQDISQEDAQAEGMELTGWRPTYNDPDSGGDCMTPVDNFAELWESIYGPGSWNANPWVWCISFKRIDA